MSYAGSTGRTVVGDVVPGRGNIAFAWGLTVVLFVACFVAMQAFTLFVLSPFGAKPDPVDPNLVDFEPWVSLLALGISWFVSVVFVTAGGGSGVVWHWAEMRVVDGSGTQVSWLRRALRPGLLSALVLGSMAVLHENGGLLVGLLFVAVALVTSLLAADRRGVMEKVLGLRDVAYGQVPAPEQPTQT